MLTLAFPFMILLVALIIWLIMSGGFEKLGSVIINKFDELFK
jgi:hypothetical protein